MIPFVACVCASFVAGAQTPVFRGGVETVEVTVTVTDANRRLITGLTRKDFAVYEDGRPETITHFSNQRVPVSLGVLLDVSDSMRGQPMADARLALDRFVGDLLTAEDEAFVAAFHHSSWTVVDWTSPSDSLRGRLSDVRPSGGTSIYGAIAKTTPQFDRRRHMRSALVVVSDGADTASDLTLGQARESLRRSDPFVYAIAIDAGDPRRVSTRVTPSVLREITGPSGGYTEVIRTAAELGAATERIAYELNHQYTIGYSASRRPDGQWRSIRVRMRDRGHFARARRGYFAILRSN